MTPNASPTDQANARLLSREREVRAAQVRLLYENANLGVAVTLFATAVLGCVQWGFVPHQIIVAWCVYMCAVSVARHVLTRRYKRNTRPGAETDWWGSAFAIGAGLAGTGW